MSKSKLDFSKDPEYFKKEYKCEICGDIHKFDDMSTCDRCQKFVCSKCSKSVIEDNVNYDFLCNECIKELIHEK